MHLRAKNTSTYAVSMCIQFFNKFMVQRTWYTRVSTHSSLFSFIEEKRELYLNSIGDGFVE